MTISLPYISPRLSSSSVFHPGLVAIDCGFITAKLRLGVSCGEPFPVLCFGYTQKTCRRVALVSCKSCSSVLGEAVAPGIHHFKLIFINSHNFNCVYDPFSVESPRDPETVHHPGGSGAGCGRQRARSFT